MYFTPANVLEAPVLNRTMYSYVKIFTATDCALEKKGKMQNPRDKRAKLVANAVRLRASTKEKRLFGIA
jgi:hypothetical protein